MCHISIVFNFVFELVVLNKSIELVTESPRLVRVFVDFVVGKDIVNTARFDALFMATLQALEP